MQSRAMQAAKREMARRKKARNSLLGFTCFTNPHYKVAHIHRLIADKLEAVERGEIKRLMIECPPRHGKSELVSRRFPPWALGRNPRLEFISASYGADLATDFGRDVRNTLSSPEYIKLFPNIRLAADSKAKNRWHTFAGGGFVAAGVGSPITGRGADILNIDDPVKDRADAESETIRDSIWSWYTSTAYTRLMPDAAVILTMTRWHEQDLAGRLRAAEENGTGDQWHKLVLPAINEDGTALWPEHYPLEVLRQTRSVIGEMDWAALYEQRPRPPGGSFFTLSDMLVNDQPIKTPAPIDTVFATIDSATKTGKTNDATAVIYWGRSQHAGIPLVILDWDIVQIEGALLEAWMPSVFARLEELATETRARFGSSGAWIEDKASGMILLQQAMRRNWPARAIDSKLTSVGKVERAINISGYVFRKAVKFTQAAYDKVKTHKGVSRNHLLTQVLAFHVGTKDMGADDLLDCFTYGIALALGNNQGF